MSDEEIKQLMIILKKYDHTINVLAQALANHAIVFLPLVKKCEAADCDSPATVVQPTTEKVFCDRCCAEMIIDAKLLDDALDNVIPAEESTEDLWRDLPQAKEIRLIATHRDLCNELYEIVPEQSKLH